MASAGIPIAIKALALFLPDNSGDMPIGPYADFAECVAANQDKDDPEAYCGYLEAQTRQYGIMDTPTLPYAARGEYEGIFTKVERAEDGAVRWKATVSDDGVDRYHSRMTLDLFDDFIRNFKAGTPVWHTVAHFYGMARIGETTALYRDGRKLKAEGRFWTDHDDPFIRELATAAANAALDDAKANKLPSKRAIKTSIGFTPRASVVEDMGVIAYTMGELNEITMTTHAANSRTDFGGEAMTKRALDPAFMEEDAASIVGPDLAKQLREKLDELEARTGAPEDTDALVLLYRAALEAVTTEPEPPTDARAYTGPDDESLPDHVKEMPLDMRKVWVKTFNNALDNDASTADARKAADAFTENMMAKQDKAAPDAGSDIATTTEEAKAEPVTEERAGRKIQGKKLAEMQAALETLQSIVTWAAEEPADGEDRSVMERLAARFAGDEISEDGLAAVAQQRYMELTGAESLTDVLDMNEMHQYMCTLIYTLQDIIMANLSMENEMAMEERMGNIDSAIGDFTQLINGMVGSYFSNGRSVDNTDMKDVKPTDNGTAPVKPEGASEAAEVRAVLDRVAEAVEAGDAAGVQDALNQLGPALEDALPEEQVPPAGNEMPAEVREELNELRMGQQAIQQMLEEMRQDRPQPAEARTEDYKPQPPRRASFTKPPTQRSYPAPRTDEPTTDDNGIRGRTIRELAERGAPRSRFP